MKLSDDAGGAPVLADEDGRFTLRSVAAASTLPVAKKTVYVGATSAASDGIQIRMLKRRSLAA